MATFDIFTYYEKENKTPTTEEVRNAINIRIRNKNPEDDSITLTDAISIFITQQKVVASWTLNTVKAYQVLKTKIKEIAPTVKLGELNRGFFVSFIDALYKEEAHSTTVKSLLTRLKSCLKGLDSLGYRVPQDYKTFTPKIKQIERKVVYLTKDELLRIYNADIKPSKIQLARDLFCFCAFTGLRISDARDLQWANVNDNSITIVTKKTNKSIEIELNAYARAILQRQSKTSNEVFAPYIDTPILCKSLKSIARGCDISDPITLEYYQGGERVVKTFKKWELIGTHTARRSFVCLALSLGIPPNIVMKWTGHKDYSSMRPYIDIMKEEKAKAMALFNSLK